MKFDNPAVRKKLSPVLIRSSLVSQTKNAIAHTKEAYAATTPKSVQELKSYKELFDELLYKLKLKKRVYLPDLRQVSPDHGRAVYESIGGNPALWEDENGILHGMRDHKGTLMESEREINDDMYGHYMLRVEGMKDGWVLSRILKASEYLGKRGIPTEAITEVRKLDQVVDNGQVIDIDEWKDYAIQAYLRNPWKRGGHDAPEERVREYMKADFYALTRDLQVEERLRDLGHLSKGDYHQFMEPIIKWYRLASKYRPDQFTPIDQNVQGLPGEPLSEAELSDFMNRVVPTNMGRNVALTHLYDLAHGWCHAQNFSLVGTYYDVDSVHGSPLGDKAITEQDIKRDFSMTLKALEETSTAFVQPIIRNKAILNFVVSYMDTTKGENNWSFDDVAKLVDTDFFGTEYPYILFGAEIEIRAFTENRTAQKFN